MRDISSRRRTDAGGYIIASVRLAVVRFDTPSFISIDVTAAVRTWFYFAGTFNERKAITFHLISRHSTITSMYNYRGLVNKRQKAVPARLISVVPFFSFPWKSRPSSRTGVVGITGASHKAYNFRPPNHTSRIRTVMTLMLSPAAAKQFPTVNAK